MEFIKLRPQRKNLLIGYKLLVDLLFIILTFFTLALIADGIIPGLITSQIGFLKIVILAVFDLAAIYTVANFIEKELSETKSLKKSQNKLLYFLFFVLILLILNSLFKLNIFLAVFILLITAAIFYLLYRVISEEK